MKYIALLNPRKAPRSVLVTAAGLMLITVFLSPLDNRIEPALDLTLQRQTSALPMPGAEQPSPQGKSASSHNSEESAGSSTISTESLSTPELAEFVLQAYQLPDMTIEDREAVRSFLKAISTTAQGKDLISQLFYTSSPTGVAASIYDLILDADLKDPELIKILIEKSKTELEATYHHRLVDLIADLNTVEQSYSPEIEDFLAETTLHADPKLRSLALSQWAWYANRHRGIVPVLNTYLFHHSREAREEIYEMIQLDSITDPSDKAELITALSALGRSDSVRISEEESLRILHLKEKLSTLPISGSE